MPASFDYVAKQTVEASLTLDIYTLVRNGYVAEQITATGEIRWSYGEHQPKATVGFVTNTVDSARPFMRLHYTSDGAQTDDRVELISVPQPFGGVRWWFLCPVTGTKCRKLYLPRGKRHFAGREGHGLVYESQRETPVWRAVRRADKIRARLGGGPVLNSKGEVIGVSVATFRGGQNLNFAIPSVYLEALLEKTGPAKPLAEAKPSKAPRAILSDLGGRSVEGVVGGTFAWQNQGYGVNGGAYTITLRNRLREPVKNVYCLVVFYDRNGDSLDVDTLHHRGVIPAGLGKRSSGGVDASVKRLTTPPSRDNQYLSSFAPTTKVEFRILDFEIVQ